MGVSGADRGSRYQSAGKSWFGFRKCLRNGKATVTKRCCGAHDCLVKGTDTSASLRRVSARLLREIGLLPPRSVATGASGGDYFALNVKKSATSQIAFGILCILRDSSFSSSPTQHPYNLIALNEQAWPAYGFGCRTTNQEAVLKIICELFKTRRGTSSDGGSDWAVTPRQKSRFHPF